MLAFSREGQDLKDRAQKVLLYEPLGLFLDRAAAHEGALRHRLHDPEHRLELLRIEGVPVAAVYELLKGAEVMALRHHREQRLLEDSLYRIKREEAVGEVMGTQDMRKRHALARLQEVIGDAVNLVSSQHLFERVALPLLRASLRIDGRRRRVRREQVHPGEEDVAEVRVPPDHRTQACRGDVQSRRAPHAVEHVWCPEGVGAAEKRLPYPCRKDLPLGIRPPLLDSVDELDLPLHYAAYPQHNAKEADSSRGPLHREHGYVLGPRTPLHHPTHRRGDAYGKGYRHERIVVHLLHAVPEGGCCLRQGAAPREGYDPGGEQHREPLGDGYAAALDAAHVIVGSGYRHPQLGAQHYGTRDEIFRGLRELRTHGGE